jgi:transcriptional regulator with XRE-family HTH domain
MPRQSKKQAETPLGYWLLGYVATNHLSLTELSRLAGLSDGTLRSLIYFPDRMPSLETCVRLAKATGYPASEFLRLAGVVETAAVDHIDPQRVDLLRIYEQLRPDLQRMLVMIAESLQKFNRPEPPVDPGE